MTSLCADVRERSGLGRPMSDDAAHVAACPQCGVEAAELAGLAAAFAAARIDEPTPALATRVLRAASPVLAARRRHAARRALAAAVGAALVPLPFILMIDAWALQAMYGALSRLLPPTLSFYLVLNYAAVLALLGALTYGAIPLLAERQARGRHEALHG